MFIFDTLTAQEGLYGWSYAYFYLNICHNYEP